MEKNKMKKDLLEKALREAKNAFISFTPENSIGENPDDELEFLIQRIKDLQSELTIQLWLEQHEGAVFDYYEKRLSHIKGANIPFVIANECFATLDSIKFDDTSIRFKFCPINFGAPEEIDEYTIHLGEFSKKYFISKKFIDTNDFLQIIATFTENTIQTIALLLEHKK